MDKEWELLALARKDCGRRIFTQFHLFTLAKSNMATGRYITALLIDSSTDYEQGSLQCNPHPLYEPS